MILLMAYNFALHISLASIAIDLVLTVASLLTGTSSSNCAFAVDCALDVFSSAILVWRFYGETGQCSDPNYDRNYQFNLSANQSAASQRKELIACMGLGIMFIISGLIVITKSSWDLMVAEEFINLEPDMNGLPGILHVTSVAFVICGLLAWGKYVLYKYMQSNSMYLESINSWISSIFAFVIVITTIIIQYDNKLWVLDPIISLVFSVFMIVYGILNIKKSWRKLRDNFDCTADKLKVHYVVIP